MRRLGLILGLGAILGVAVSLVLFALRDQIVFFYSPSQLTQVEQAGRPLRLGGLVKDGTWRRSGIQNEFVVTDGVADIRVRFAGIVPDLFREGQVVLAEGSVQPDGTMVATNVLAKHDEYYMPRPVGDALEKGGVWRHAP